MYFAGTRVQFNALTSYIDANFVYGSNPVVADSLRTFKDGLLRTVPAFHDIGLKPLLPPKTFQPLDGCVPPSPDVYCFLAGNIYIFHTRHYWFFEKQIM